MLRRLTGVVLRRELVRLARRHQTWTLRATYTGFLLGFCLLQLAGYDTATTDPAYLGYVGRQVYRIYTVIQLFAVCVMAPLLVASGLQEERDAKTLDLLTLTGVSAGRILYDQIASRLFSLFTVLMVGLPFLGILSTFGGYAPIEVFNATIGTAMIAVILGTFAGFTALVTRGGPLLPLALCLPYALVVFGIPSIVISVLVDDDLVPLVSPLVAPFVDHWAVFLGALVWLPGLWSWHHLAVPVFRIEAGGAEHDDGYGLLSPDIWAVERFKKRTWAYGAAFLAGLTACCFTDAIVSGRGIAMFILGWVTTILLLVLLQRLSLIAVLTLAERVRNLLRNPIRLIGSASLGPRRVWDHLPVAWRESQTRSGGQARALPLVLCALWLFVVCLMAAIEDFDGELWFGQAIFAQSMAAFSAAVVGIALAVDERSRKTLSLLFLTRLTPQAIAQQKALAPMVITGPLLLISVLITWVLPTQIHPYSDHELGENLLVGLPGVGRLFWSVWQLLTITNAGLVASLLATLSRSNRTAWAMGLAAAFVFTSWPLLLVTFLEILDVQRPAADHFKLAVLTWYPFLDYRALFCERGGLSAGAALAVAVQGALAMVGTQTLAWALRREVRS